MKKTLLLYLGLLLSPSLPRIYAQNKAGGTSSLSTTRKLNAEDKGREGRVIPAAIPVEVTVKVKQDPSSASITDKHPNAVYFILIAAGLAAIASLGSSIITSLVAWRVKKVEYKNDYHKKVLEKRMQALEYAEALNSMFRPYGWRGEGEEFHDFFLNRGELKKFYLIDKKITTHTLWYEWDTFVALRDFSSVVKDILEKIGELESEDDKEDYCISEYNKIEKRRKLITKLVACDLKSLHEVDAFFERLAQVTHRVYEE